MDINKFYHHDYIFKYFCRDTSLPLRTVLRNCCMNDNPVAVMLLGMSDGVLTSDLDISISPESDPSVRSFVEQLRTELPVTMPSYNLSDDDLFNMIIPNNSQFGEEVNNYLDNLRDYVRSTLPNEALTTE